MGVKKKSDPESVAGLLQDEIAANILMATGWLDFLEKFEGF